MPLAEQCQIFNDKEIASFRKGGGILRDCLKHVSSLVKPGISTLSLDEAAEAFIRGQGGLPAFKGYRGFTGSLCTSINDAVVHGIPKAGVILEEGDIVSLDCGVIYDSLYTDACVTVPVGTISPKAQKFLETVSKILEDVLDEVVKADVRVGDISSFIEKNLRRHGYKPVVSLTGHGVGYSLHQFPDVPNVGESGMGPKLPAGTVIAIEPIAVVGDPEVYTDIDGWTVKTRDQSLACHFEHSVLIKEGGCEVIA